MNGYNFTERVRRVLAMAREEAARLHHAHVGTEHMLLAILREGNGVAASVLERSAVDGDALAKRVAELAEPGTTSLASGPDLPYTAAAKRVLELAMNQAHELNHSYVGTEHLLLGLVGQGKGVAARALTEAGLSFEAVRASILEVLGVEHPRPGMWLDDTIGRAVDRVEIALRFKDGEVRQRSFATPREAAEYLRRGGVS